MSPPLDRLPHLEFKAVHAAPRLGLSGIARTKPMAPGGPFLFTQALRPCFACVHACVRVWTWGMWRETESPLAALLLYCFTAFLLFVCVCVQAASGVKLNPFGNAAPRDEAAFQVTKPKAN